MSSSIESPITQFCKRKGIPSKIQSAFGAYIRHHYASKFNMKESGETIHIVLNRMSQDDLEDAWMDFVKDMSKQLPTSQGSE